MSEEVEDKKPAIQMVVKLRAIAGDECLGITIPKALVQALGLIEGTMMKLVVEEKQIIVTPIFI